jgi:hypothetical protein
VELINLSPYCSIYSVHDEVKDKEFELELSWICEESKYQHEMVPNAIAKEAERLAKVSFEYSMPKIFLGHTVTHFLIEGIDNC